MIGDGISILACGMWNFSDRPLCVCSVDYLFATRCLYKTFKGTTRKAYIHKDSKPIEYWFSVIAQMIIGVVMTGFGFWLLDDLPAFHNWHTEIRAMLPFDSTFDKTKPRSGGVFITWRNHGHQSARR
jgi:hypothetical protein